MMNRSTEPGWPDPMDRKSGAAATHGMSPVAAPRGMSSAAPRRHGCWIHCYPDHDARRFIVRETFENGTLALSSIMTRAESDTERVLVAAGASPGEAHDRVQEAIVRGTAFLFLD